MLTLEYQGIITYEHTLINCVQEFGAWFCFLACVRFQNSILPIFTSIWWPLFSSPSLDSGIGGPELEPKPAEELRK